MASAKHGAPLKIAPRALAFASLWFDDTTVHRVFEPLIADWDRECAEATREKKWLALARGGGSFALTCVMLAPRAFVLAQLPAETNRRVLIA